MADTVVEEEEEHDDGEMENVKIDAVNVPRRNSMEGHLGASGKDDEVIAKFHQALFSSLHRKFLLRDLLSKLSQLQSPQWIVD